MAATWTARRPTRLAIVSAGYADGYFRAGGSNDGTRGAEVMVAGKRCPIAGRISMDLMAVDVTDLEKNAARRGHMVTLIGEGITVDELAHHFGTIGYEVLTSLGSRYARVYKGGAADGASRCRRRASFALLLLRVEHLLAGIAERVVLLVETRDDAAAAGHGARAVFVIIRLAGGPLFGGQALREGGGGKSNGQYGNGDR